MPSARHLAALGLYVREGFLGEAARRGLEREADRSRRASAAIFGDAEYVDDRRFRAQVVRLRPETLSGLRRRLDRARPAVERHFGLALGPAETPRLLNYRPGDFVVRHRDRVDSPGAPRGFQTRKIAVVTFLSDRYEGGELVLFGLLDGAFRKAGLAFRGGAGTLIAFPVRLAHEVRPVVAGRRRTLVSWFPEREKAAP